MKTRNITVDCGKTTILDRSFNFCISAGRAGEVMRYHAAEQLKKLVQECGFRYIRFHGIFHEDMGIYYEDGNGNSRYNWQYADQLFDLLLEIGIRPFVELSFMPKELASGENTVFWWKSNITPPKDHNKWGDLVKAFTEHMTARYGRDEVKKWFFEVWNEPNLDMFFAPKDKLTEYFKIYDVSATAVKSVDAEYKVGGPATAENAWVPEFIAHCAENNVPVDFITTHTYSVDLSFNAFGKCDQYLRHPDEICAEVVDVESQVKNSAYPDLPIYYTEWGISCSPLDPIHDSYLNASASLYSMKRMKGHLDAMSYWSYSDIIEEAGVPKVPLHGGFGIITVQSIPKPTYYAYKLLNSLSDTELVTNDPDSVACLYDDGIGVLFWNFTMPDQNGVPNAQYFVDPYPSKEWGSVDLDVSGLDNGRYEVVLQTIGYKKGDLKSAYYELNIKDTPTREQTDLLMKKSKPEKESLGIINVTEGKLQHSVTINENDICFLTVKKISN